MSLAHFSLAKVGFFKMGLTQVSFKKVNILEVGFTEIGSTKVGPTEAGVAESSPFEVSSTKVWMSHLRMRFPPLVPFLGALLEDIEMRLVSHVARNLLFGVCTYFSRATLTTV